MKSLYRFALAALLLLSTNLLYAQGASPLGVYGGETTSAKLPVPVGVYGEGTIAFTSDHGMMVSHNGAWVTEAAYLFASPAITTGFSVSNSALATNQKTFTVEVESPGTLGIRKTTDAGVVNTSSGIEIDSSSGVVANISFYTNLTNGAIQQSLTFGAGSDLHQDCGATNPNCEASYILEDDGDTTGYSQIVLTDGTTHQNQGTLSCLPGDSTLGALITNGPTGGYCYFMEQSSTEGGNGWPIVLATADTEALRIDGNTQAVAFDSAIISKGTVPTIASCGTPTVTGGAFAGTFAAGATTCNFVVTLPVTVAHKYYCTANDETHAITFRETAFTTATVTFTESGAVTANDVIDFSCTGF